MLKTVLWALEGVASTFYDCVKAILDFLVDWFTGLTGLDVTIPPAIIQMIHSAALLVDAFMPLHYFITGVGVLCTVYLAWIAWKVTWAAIHLAMRAIDWIGETGVAISGFLTGL